MQPTPGAQRCAAAAMIAAAAASVFAAPPPAPTFRLLGYTPNDGHVLRLSGVSADASVIAATDSYRFRAIRWTLAAGLQDLPVPPNTGRDEQASAVSADGRTIVGSQDAYYGKYSTATCWRGSDVVTLGMLPLAPNDNIPSSYALSASADGSVIVGKSSSVNATGGASEAFRWSAATGMVGLGFFPNATNRSSGANAVSVDGRVIVGYSSWGSGYGRAFRWTAETGMESLGYLPTPVDPSSSATVVSADGNVIAGYSTAGSWSTTHAFRWTPADGMQDLGNLPGVYPAIAVLGMSADGGILVGGAGESPRLAFIWDTSHGLRRLDDMLRSDYHIDLGSWRLTEATGISPDGLTIVGNAQNGTDYRGFIVTLPEPSGGLAFALIALIARRR